MEMIYGIEGIMYLWEQNENGNLDQISRKNSPVVFGAWPRPQYRVTGGMTMIYLTTVLHLPYTHTKNTKQIFLQNGSHHPVQCQKTILESHRFNTLETGPSSNTTK